MSDVEEFTQIVLYKVHLHYITTVIQPETEIWSAQYVANSEFTDGKEANHSRWEFVVWEFVP